MINFEEELKRFHPSLEIDEAEDVIYNNNNMSDMTDIIIELLNSKDGQNK